MASRDEIECRAQCIGVRARSERVNRAMARRARGVARDDFAQAAKFEEFFGGAAHQFKMRERARSVKLIEKGKTKFEKRSSKIGRSAMPCLGNGFNVASEFRSEVVSGSDGLVGNVNEALGGFAPLGGVADFDFADAFDDGLPEVAEGHEGLVAHHAFVDHFPNDREFDECPGAAGARDVAGADAHELEEALLPRGDAHFFIHPAIRARAEEFSGDRERAARLLLSRRVTPLPSRLRSRRCKR